MRPYVEIEQMILDHIKEIDKKIHIMEYNTASSISFASFSDMYKAKSLALQALAELKNGVDGK